MKRRFLLWRAFKLLVGEYLAIDNTRERWKTLIYIIVADMDHH